MQTPQRNTNTEILKNEYVGGLIRVSAASFNTRGYFMSNRFMLLFLIFILSVLQLVRLLKNEVSCCDRFPSETFSQWTIVTSCSYYYHRILFFFFLRALYLFLFCLYWIYFNDPRLITHCHLASYLFKNSPLCTRSNGVMYNHAC